MERASKISGGVKTLSDEQKSEIAEIRSIAEAKIAEESVMLDKKLASLAGHPMQTAESDLLRQEFIRIKESVEADAETKIEKVKQAG